MLIKQDPVTGLWARSDGAILMPPGGNYKKFRWTFGSDDGHGYRKIQYRRKHYQVHILVSRAFHGLPPADKPCVDHLNRDRSDNRPCNLHWVDYKENADNQADVGKSVEAYGVRYCDDKKAYIKSYRVVHHAERMAYDNAYRAEKKAQGLVHRRGPDGKTRWLPRIRKGGGA